MTRYRHPLYSVYHGMIQRCYNPNNLNYKNYGARGIKVASRWLESFDNFLTDMGERPKDYLLDRIDNDNHYTLDNCRWVTRSKSNKNRRCKADKQSNIDYVGYDKSRNTWEYRRTFKTQRAAERFALNAEAEENYFDTH